MGKLTALAVRTAKPGRHIDGQGLHLLVKPSGARSWLLRVQVNKHRRDIGLGSITDLTLAEAREKAAGLRKAARAGLDPKTERDKHLVPTVTTPTFSVAAKACHEALKGGWSARHIETFLSSLERHAFPTIGEKLVSEIVARDVSELLRPIWLTIPDMARKVRQRVGIVLNFAQAEEWRKEAAPGKAVTIALPKQVAGSNYEAMPYAQVPAFVALVRTRPETMGRLALLLTIYTAARSGEVRHMLWAHVDLAAKLWNRPAELMKTKKAHSITLNAGALAILERVALLQDGDPQSLVFPGMKGKPLSDMTLSKVLRDEKVPATVHGFRSSFRDWAAEKMPHIPDPVAEMALAHIVSDKVMAAYKRTEFQDMRRTLLAAWSAFLAPREAGTDDARVDKSAACAPARA